MPYMNDEVFDQGLDYVVAQATRLDICYTSEPTTYAQATDTKSCGNKTGITVGATEAGATDGRRVIIPAITDGSVTADKTAGWWGLTDGAAVLIAAGELSAPQGVTNGNPFTLDAISITKRDAT